MSGNSSLFKLSDPDEEIVNVFSSVQNDKTYIFIHAQNQTSGKIYYYDLDKEVLRELYSGLTCSSKSCGVDFAQGWSDVFIFSNGYEFISIAMSEGDGDTITKFTPTDVDGRAVAGYGLVVFDGRLWVFDGVVLWYSVKENCYDFSTEDPTIVTSAGYVEFTKHITAIYPYLGSLAVFHKDSSSLLSVNSDYSYSQTDESVGGCAGMSALTFHGTELYFYDDTKKGVFCFSQVVNGDKTLGKNISLDVQEELSVISSKWTDKIAMVSVVESNRNEIWFLIPNADENYSTILIYDYTHSCWVKRKSQRLSCLRAIDGELYSSDGKNLLIENRGSTFNGEFIGSYYKCSPLNFGVDNTLKILYIPPRVTTDNSYINDFMIKYVKNYNSKRLVKEKHIKSVKLGEVFYWDDSYWDSGDIFKPEDVNTITRIPTSTFKTLEMTFYTNTYRQRFCIMNIEFSRIKIKQL